MVNPKYIIPPSPTIRIYRSPTPTHMLFSKPLPEMPQRPRSADPFSSPSRRQNRGECPSPSGSADDSPLRRAPACKNRRRRSDEMYQDRRQTQQEFDFWTRPAYAVHIPTPQHQHQHQNQRPRPRSCMPTNLIWLEDEKQWTIAKPKKLPPYQRRDRLPSRASTSTRSALSPLSPIQCPISPIIPPVSPISNDQPVRFYMDRNDPNQISEDELPSPLSSCGHGFGPDPAQAGNNRVSRWLSVVERRQEYH